MIDFRFKGRRYVLDTHTKNRKLALEILREVQSDIARGIFFRDKKKKDIRFADFLTEYFANADSYKSRSTLELERAYLPRVVSNIGNKTLRSVDKYDIDRWKAKFTRQVSPATFNIVLRMLHAAFNIGKRWGYVDDNPFTGVEKLKIEERRLFLMDHELGLVSQLMDADIQAASTHGSRKNVLLFRKTFKLFIEFLLNTGLRREEALRLRINHIDLAHGVIYIEKTKTKQLRAVPLNRRAMEIIIALGEPLFSRLNKQDVTSKFRYYLAQAGLKGFKLHSLRHTFATRLMAVGVDIYTVSRLLGHTDIKTTMIYAKTNIETLKAVVEKLDKFGYVLVTREGKNENGQ